MPNSALNDLKDAAGIEVDVVSERLHDRSGVVQDEGVLRIVEWSEEFQSGGRLNGDHPWFM